MKLGPWSFSKYKKEIREIIERFAAKNGVRLNSMANVGNHLHLHLQLTNRYTYRKFIRAISSAIMMRVTGISRWKKKPRSDHFWDRRPFSRVIIGICAILRLKDYIEINKYEGAGYSRDQARFYVAWNSSATS
jgi:REP element-mobilizing transposase RayT